MAVFRQNMTSKSNDHNEHNDLYVGMRAVRIWGTLGWHDIRQRYRRSFLGPFWFTLSTAILVSALGLLYSTLLHQEITTYLPYLAVGLVIWLYLTTSVTEGCEAFIGSTYLIKQIRLPLTVHVCRIAWRSFLILFHSLPVVGIMVIAFGHRPGLEFILVPLALFLLLLHGVWMGVVLGILCARFRDISPIAVSLMQVTFFVTPIMWSPEILKDYAWVATYNPLYHLIEIVRAPIVGRPVNAESWFWAVGFLFIGFGFAQYLMQCFRNRVPYWF